MTNDIEVTSHVGRDVLQSARLFNTPGKVVLEYVMNGIEYREREDSRSTSVYVEIKPRKKTIQIKDNGMGMDTDRIKHFFTMHGEQIQEDKKIKRSEFGTGKSAAFGIAGTLVIDTYRSGKRNKLKLTKDMLNDSDGSSIKTNSILANEDTDEENGTLIIIEDIAVKVNQLDVIKSIERVLPRFKTFKPQVIVNNHICETRQLDIVDSHTIIPDEETAEIIGDVELKINVSRAPLDTEEIGIFISAGEGNLIAHETLTLTGQDMGNYITGEIDVPILREEEDGLAAYSLARDLKLNHDRKDVKVLIKFLASSAEKIRKELVKKKKERQETEEGRKLQELANEISSVLNESYLDRQKELAKIRRGAFGSGLLAKKLLPDSEDKDSEELGVFDGGIELRAEDEGENRKGDPSDNPQTPIDPPPKSLREDEEGSKTASKKPSKPRPQTKGGFHIECSHLGMEDTKSRYKYSKENVCITINLDHPSVSRAFLSANKNPKDIYFKRLMYEIAFTAYILAVAQEITEVDEMKLGSDLRFDMQELYDDVTLKASKVLYS